LPATRKRSSASFPSPGWVFRLYRKPPAVRNQFCSITAFSKREVPCSVTFSAIWVTRFGSVVGSAVYGSWIDSGAVSELIIE